MEGWKNIKIKSIAEINRVVTVFEVWSYEKIPYGKFKIKILENNKGEFIGVPNIAIKNIEDNSPEWISGVGNSVENALSDTIENFFDSIEGYNLHDDNGTVNPSFFEWAESQDF